MAKIPQGILGGLRGRVGNVVGAAWKGINYIRSMPLSVANPNTVLQQAQRGAFTQTVLVARLLLANLIATYWDPFARLMSGYNHFISINIDAFLTAGLDDPAAFFSARGILTGVSGGVIAADDSDDEITITWNDNTGNGDALTTDELYVVYYNETQDAWAFFTGAAPVRGDATLAIPNSAMVLNDVLRAWPFFVRPDLEKISDSSYITCVVLA